LIQPPTPRPVSPFGSGEKLVQRDFMMLFGGLFCFMLNLSIFFLLPYHLQLRGVSETFFGAVAGTIGLSGLVVIVLFGRYGDHFPRKMSVGLFMLPSLAGSLLAVGAIDGPPELYFAVRALHGISLALGFPLIFSWAVDISPPDRKTEAVAYLGIAGLLSNSLGPLLGELILALQRDPDRPEAYRGVFIAAAGLAVAAQVFFFLVRNPGGHGGAGRSPGGLMALAAGANPIRILAIVVIFGGVFGVVTSFGKNYAMALSLGFASILFLAHTVGAIISRAFIRVLLIRFEQTRLVAGGLTGLGVSQFILAGAGGYPMLALSGLVYGLSHGVLYPTLNIRFFDLFHRDQLGRASILFMGAFTAGTGIFPYLGGMVLESAGFRILFAATGAFFVAALWLNQKESPKRKAA
ncbi:MAG: MFS transporter, partial [Deltaproteobacteria bacterium]|nr:MFS transporter [Deltaproteobacteria bacterium]